MFQLSKARKQTKNYPRFVWRKMELCGSGKGMSYQNDICRPFGIGVFRTKDPLATGLTFDICMCAVYAQILTTFVHCRQHTIHSSDAVIIVRVISYKQVQISSFKLKT